MEIISQEQYEQFKSWSEVPENRQALNQEWEKRWEAEWLRDLPPLKLGRGIAPLVVKVYPEMLARIQGRYNEPDIDEDSRQRNLNYFGGQESFFEMINASAGLEREAIIMGMGLIVDEAEKHPEAAASIIELAEDYTQIEGNIRRLSRTKLAQENPLIEMSIDSYKAKRSEAFFLSLERQFEMYQNIISQPLTSEA